MTDTRKKNTIHEAVVIAAAIANGDVVQSRYITGNSDWKDRPVSTIVPDFIAYQYRIKPSATWIIVYTSSADTQHSWLTTDLDRAINLATQANQLGRKLQYVVKVEGDVPTIQKTPQ